MIPLRDEDPLRSFPAWTVGLVLINVLVFLHEVRLPASEVKQLVESYGAVPFEISHFARPQGKPPIPPLLTLITSQYLHGSWLHLAGNILYLWTFGRRVEDAMGWIRFPIFYTLAGVTAGITQTVMMPDSRVPLIGASGAIAGLLGGYLVRFPLTRLRILVPFWLFFRVIRLPAMVFLLLWFLLQLYSSQRQDGIAWWAHIGGFLTGILASWWFFRKKAKNA